MSYRLYVADPGLKAFNGHNAAALETLAVTCGTERVEFFCHRTPDPALHAEALRQRVRLTPFFAHSFYEAYDQPGTIADLNPFINALACDYLRLFDRVSRTDRAGLVLHHTMDWPHLMALGIANACCTESAHPLRQLVFLMFNPGVDAAGHMVNQWRALNYRVALARLSTQANVRLFASCSEHAAAYGALYPDQGPPPLHPAFLAASGPVTAPSVSSGPAGDLRRFFKGEHILLYVGDAKVEKGFCRLPDLIRLLLPYLDARSTLLIHYNLNEALASETLRAVARTLDAMAREDARIKLMGHFLADRDMVDLLAQSDLVLFHYDHEAYAQKTSGLLWQVCGCHTPVILFGESWLSREAFRLHPWVRVFDTLQQFKAELDTYGAVSFTWNAFDEPYRAALFSSFDTFVTAQSLEPIVAEPRHSLAPLERYSLRPWRRQALFIDAGMPGSGKSGGSYAASQEIRLLQALGFEISFATPDGLPGDAGPSRPDIQFCGDSAMRVLKERGSEFDLIYVTRFYVVKPLISQVRVFAPQAKLVLNVADVHFLREMRKAAVEQRESRMAYAESVREQELGVLEDVDLVLCYTDVEQAVIESHLGERARVARCPWVEEVRPDAIGYERRRDLAFLGSYSHAPNVDAVVWFVEQVMPLLRAVLPDVRFRVYGTDVPPELERLAGDDVHIEGFVEDVSVVYDACRVFVAPLRYGAGLKAKVAGALAHGTPCVLSRVAAEGLFCDDDAAAVIAEAPEEWVAHIVAYYRDPIAWAAASRAALDHAARRFRFDEGVRRLSKILRSLDSDLVL